MRTLDLSALYLMPNAGPPHKERPSETTYEDRVAMLRLAMEGTPFEICEIEKEPGTHYTADTLEELKRRHPEEDIVFLIGEDSLRDLPTWHEPERIVRVAELAVFPRRDVAESTADTLTARCREATRRYGAKITPIPMEPMDMSSTEIRERIRTGQDVTGMLDPKVKEYIIRHGLYLEE